jgi:colanic acid/amylovoran biosynthesis glycosyltransferase
MTSASTRPLRIGIWVIQFPQISETFIVTKVLKLLEAGLDVQIFTVVQSPHWDAFDALRGREDIRARVHVAPPIESLTRALSLGALEVAKVVARHPWGFASYAAHTFRRRRETPTSFLHALYQRLRFVEQRLDILHIEFDAQGIGIADLKEYLGCHVLSRARGTFQRLSINTWMPDAFAYISRYADGYHFISNFLDDNTHRLGLPADIPTWHIEPAIDLTLFSPPKARTRARGAPLKLISVGRLSWAKGYEFALDAVARVREAGVALDYTIYGAGPYAEPIRFAIRQLGLADCVRLGGSLKRDDVPKAYADADIMVHAAIEEGFCNAVIEAQAMELPVVTSDSGGLPENVEDGVTGLVVPRRDPDAMAAQILVLARDPALRNRMGRAGRARALARFDLDAQAAAFVRLYRDLAALPVRPVLRK